MATEQSRPVIIGVTGGSSSGKTSVSRAIYDELANESIMILQQDAYYNDQSEMTMAERRAVNYDHPLAFDTDLLVEQLNQLRHNQPIEEPVYDYTILPEVKKRFIKNLRMSLLLKESWF